MSNLPILTNVVMRDITTEAQSAVTKHGVHAMLHPDMIGGDLRRLAVLGEEFGEVCQTLTYDGLNGGTPGILDLYGELKQVAAMAASWMQVIRDGHPELFE